MTIHSAVAYYYTEIFSAGMQPSLLLVFVLMLPRNVQRLVCLLAHSSILTVALEANITIPPQPVNISLNGVAEFTCTATADVFQWEANGIQLTNNGETVVIPTIKVVNLTQAIRMSTLQLRAVPPLVVSATNITCIAIRVLPLSTDESEPALLLIQDLLECVSNLTATFVNSTTVLISWSPPFTLEGVPILGYNVTIIIDKENEVVIIEEDFTMLYYSFDHPFLNNELIVTVAPINEGGAGKSKVITFNNLYHTSSSNVIQTSSEEIQSTLYVLAVPKMNSTAIITELVYVTISSTKVQFTMILNSSNNITPSHNNMVPNATDNVTVSVLLLALIGVSAFAVVIILLSITVAITCCCHHKTRTIIIKTEKTPPPQDVALPVSNNPAYKLVTVVKDHNKDTKTLSQDYEDIEEVYFKCTNEDDNNSNYEPVECR